MLPMIIQQIKSIVNTLYGLLIKMKYISHKDARCTDVKPLSANECCRFHTLTPCIIFIIFITFKSFMVKMDFSVPC